MDRVWPAESTSAKILRNVVLVLAGTALIAISSKILVPFWPVHMTMQTAVIMIIAAAYGWRLGTLTVIAYLVEGAMGLPVFTGTPAKGIGIAYMLGSTGGYLLGFVALAFVVGWAAERGFDRRPVMLTGAMLVGEVIMYALGIFWLGYLMGWDKPILEWGLYPFLAAEVVKIALAVAAVSLGWRVFRGIRG
ncbi:MAG: biotin transporter BioY [Rhodobiaceae bacterium]|nr:biotin transporter BioY [Rhodobiaceae bacterium]MCC0054755.1 biotin transporter BioY [Rhodobiaceae bacterium]